MHYSLWAHSVGADVKQERDPVAGASIYRILPRWLTFGRDPVGPLPPWFFMLRYSPRVTMTGTQNISPTARWECHQNPDGLQYPCKLPP